MNTSSTVLFSRCSLKCIAPSAAPKLYPAGEPSFVIECKGSRFVQQRGCVRDRRNFPSAAEFAWDPGAISALSSLISGSRQCTTRLQIQFEEHPNLGKGLLCRLDLPLHLTDAETFRLAISLNQMEFTAENWPPFLGAWTAMPQSWYPTFVSFWPNLFANAVDRNDYDVDGRPSASFAGVAT